MNTSQARCRIPRVVRWTAPFVVAIGIAGCGGTESPPAATGAIDASGVATPAPVATPAGSATPSTLAIDRLATPPTAAPGPGGPQTQVVVAGVLPRAKRPSQATVGGSERANTPARWLDADLPQGTPGQPVVVVVPGALPKEAASLGLERSAVQRLAR